MSDEPQFYVYVIAFDQEVFGTYATRQDAEAALQEQIAEGGPAWDDCHVVRLTVWGTPELGRDSNQDREQNDG